MATNQLPLRKKGIFGGVGNFFGGIGSRVTGGVKRAATVTGRGFGAAGRVFAGTNRVNYNRNAKGLLIIMNNKTKQGIIAGLGANKALFNQARKNKGILTLAEFVQYLNGNNRRKNRARTNIRIALKEALANKKIRNIASAAQEKQNTFQRLASVHGNNNLNSNERNALLNALNRMYPGTKNMYTKSGSTSLRHFLHYLNDTVNVRSISANNLDDEIIKALKAKANAKATANANAKTKANARKAALNTRLAKFKPVKINNANTAIPVKLSNVNVSNGVSRSGPMAGG
jgi:hypothetical protein